MLINILILHVIKIQLERSDVLFQGGGGSKVQIELMLQAALQKVPQMKVVNHVPWALGMAKKE